MSKRGFGRDKKIFHGIVNICGIAGSTAHHQRKKGFVSEAIVFEANPLYTNHDYNLDLKQCDRQYRIFLFVLFVKAFRILRNFVRCLFRYDIFNFYYCLSLLPMHIDMPLLKLCGKKIIVIAVGSDVRLHEIIRKQNPYHQLLKESTSKSHPDSIKKAKLKWQKLWVDRFVAIRSVYDHVAYAIGPEKVVSDIWINNMVDLSEYQPYYHVNDPPMIVHAPTRRSIKGTDFVMRAIEGLRAKGFAFTFKLIENTFAEEARRIYRDESDIIVDQLLIGDFGSLAVEGMYYGKCVCCYILDEVKEKHFPDCPIVNCTVDNLEEKLAELLNNPHERIRLGKEGRAFVEKHCDANKITERLLTLYQSCYE